MLIVIFITEKAIENKKAWKFVLTKKKKILNSPKSKICKTEVMPN